MYIVSARGVFKTMSNIKDEAFCENSYGFEPLSIFAKRSFLDV